MTDALSQIISFIDVRSARCTRFEASGGWAFRFPAKPALKFAAVLSGRCWIALPGEEPKALRAGDTFLLANAPDYVLASALDAEPTDGIAAFDWDHSDVARHGGAETALLAGSFTLDEGSAPLLLGALPRFMPIPAASDAAGTLQATLQILDREIRRTETGSRLVTERLADVLLVQALRAYIATHGETSAGWIGALADPRLGVAIDLMHGDVARRWTVESLARAVGMSRSAFAAAFKARVGVAPLDYLLQWRLRVAAAALRRGETVARVARSVGYGSESAFANAFKREMGVAPKRYALEARVEV